MASKGGKPMPSPRRPPIKRTKDERSPYPQQTLTPSAMNQKRLDSRISPHTANMHGMMRVGGASFGGTEGGATETNNKSRTSKQKKFLSALRSKSKAGGESTTSTSPITASSMDAIMMPPPFPKNPNERGTSGGAEGNDVEYSIPNSFLNFNPSSSSSSGAPPPPGNFDNLDMIEMDNMNIGGEGLGDLGDSLFEYAPGDEGTDFAGLSMDAYGGYSAEGFGGFEMGMVGDDFAPVGMGIPPLPHERAAHEELIASTRTRPKKKTSTSKGETKSRGKKAKAPKVILMHEDGTTPNWEERLKKSMKPRRERKPPVGGKWSEEEDAKLKHIVETHGAKNWKGIAELLGTLRNDVQCLHRWNKVLKPGLHKGPWTQEEDNIVRYMVMEHGVGMVKWSVIASQLQGRIGKQCRERWFNHLDPAIKKGEWNEIEDNVVFEAQLVFGNRWSEIAKLLPGRTENAVKNRFNSSAHKKWLALQPPEKQVIKKTGIVKEPNPEEIKRVYRLAEVLFVQAAKDKEKRGAEYAKKPLQKPPPLPPRKLELEGGAASSSGAAGGSQGIVKKEGKEGSAKSGVAKKSKASKAPIHVGGVVGGGAQAMTGMAMEGKPPTPIKGLLTASDDAILENDLFEIINDSVEGEGMGITEAVQAVARVDSTTSSNSSPSSMSGMPDHLRPPGLKIKIEEGGSVGPSSGSHTSSLSSRNSMYQETPVTQAMRLAGVYSGNAGNTPSNSSGSGGNNIQKGKSGSEGGKANVATDVGKTAAVSGTSNSPSDVVSSEGKDLPLDLGVKIFHHLNPAAQRDIMKQLIEKKLVEQYESMSIGGKGGDEEGAQKKGKQEAAGAGGVGVVGSPVGLPFNINADELDLTGILEVGGVVGGVGGSSNLGDLIGAGNDAAIRTGFTPRGLMATPSGAERGREATDHDTIMQVAVSEAAKAVGVGGSSSMVGGGMDVEGMVEDGGLDEFTSDVLKGL